MNSTSQPEAIYPDDESGIAAVEASIEGGDAPAKRERTNTSVWNYPATYCLIAINVLVYAVMFRFGPVTQMLHEHAWQSVLTAPFDTDTLVRFGATSSKEVLEGQWWRLLTGAFVHVTLLHMLLNMWCLWNLGLFGEPLLGRRGLVAVYLLTGTAGMLLGIAFNAFLVAGASGAVFGIAGILVVLLSNRNLSVPWEELRKLRRQVIYFAVINLVLGFLPDVLAGVAGERLSALHIDPAMLPHISNSAHFGGFVSGLALGLPLFPKMTTGRSSYRHRQAWTYTVAALVLCLVVYALTRR